MKKTIISVLVVFSMILAFAACSNAGKDSKVSTQNTPNSSGEVTDKVPETEEKPVTTEKPTPETTEEPVVTEEPGPKFYGEHVFYATNGAYGIYWQFTISEDSGEFQELHTYYTATEYDGSGAIDTSQNAIKHADFKYEITDGKLKITFANYLADGSPEGSDYWFANLIKVGLDEQYTVDFDFETDHILVVTFGS